MENNNCPACKTEFSERVEFCSKCEFPFNGTEKEKAIHIGRFIGKKGVIADSSIYIKKSQNILYFIAGLNIFSLIL